MAERRSLSNAIATPVPGVDEELVRSFVTQNKPSERPVAEAPKPLEEIRVVKRPQETTSSPASRETPREASPTPPSEQKPIRQKPKKPNRFHPVGLIPVTVRLRPEIAGALKRASLERELAGEDVFTQQAIVEEALEPWLADAGFLD